MAGETSGPGAAVVNTDVLAAGLDDGGDASTDETTETGDDGAAEGDEPTSDEPIEGTEEGGEPAEGDEPPEEGAEETPEGEPQPKKPAETPDDWTKAGDQETKDVYGMIPAHLRELCKGNRELRNRIMRDIAVRQHLGWDYSTLKELRQVVTTAEQARTLHGMAKRAVEIDRKFRGAPQDFVEDLAVSDPQAYEGVAQIIYQKELTKPPVRAAALRMFLKEAIQIAHQAANERNDEELRDLATQFGERMLGKPAPPAPVDPEKERMKRELDERRAREADGGGIVDRVSSYTHDATMKRLQARILAKIDGNGAGFNTWTRTAIEREAGNRALQVLQDDPVYERQLEAAMAEAMRTGLSEPIDKLLDAKLERELKPIMDDLIAQARAQAVQKSKADAAHARSVRHVAPGNTGRPAPPARKPAPRGPTSMMDRLLNGTGLKLS